jgi:hypothetical protein
MNQPEQAKQTTAKPIIGAALAGFFVALALGAREWYVNVHTVPVNSSDITFVRISSWLWPTSILNGPYGLGTACDFSACAFLLMISAIANAMVYALLAFCGRFVWKKWIYKTIEPRNGAA